jgi:hypothetical protein
VGMTTETPNTPQVRAPDRRRLQAFAFDPMSTRLSGRRVAIDVTFERDLQPGPVGELVQVVDYDGTRGVCYRPVDLDDPWILAQDGLRPTEGDPRTHQQVVYAVAMSVLERFERFLGRRFRWKKENALVLVPHAFEGRNAFFDPHRRAVLFGYFRADAADPGANLPGQLMFTCLSTDIVAHEVSHAIVHRLRPYYMVPTNPDVFAWHEAFADLVALFHHFAFPEVIVDAVSQVQGDLSKGAGILDLAREFGESTGRGKALRSALAVEKPGPEAFARAVEAHERGACFVAGVFDAYLETYRRRIADLLRISTGGSGVLPAGRLHPDLVARIADEAVKNADRYLGIVVRAFDYLPVVDVTFGDVLRAIVTADRALYPDDASQFRATLVEALRRRGIYPTQISSLADEALAWPAPPVPMNLIDPWVHPALDLSGVILSATHDLDPFGAAGEVRSDESSAVGWDASPPTMGANTAPAAQALVAWANDKAIELGLDPNGGPIALAGVHVVYRQAADRQPRPEVVVQFAQRREDLEDQTLDERDRVIMRAGTTVIARVDGTIDYLIAKPLPLANGAQLETLDASKRDVARRYHEAGLERCARIRQWLGDLDEDDALSAWMTQPAAQRLTFAALHAAMS